VLDRVELNLIRAAVADNERSWFMRRLVIGLCIFTALSPNNLSTAGVFAKAGLSERTHAARHLAAGATAQNRTARKKNYVFCDYPGSASGRRREFNFASVLEAEQLVERVLRAVGVNRSVIGIEETDDENVNAKSGIYDGHLFIYYNPAFIDWIVRVTGTDRAADFVIVHEVGHLQAGHPFEDDGSNPQEEQQIHYRQELEADSYAGFHLRRMGATLDETLAAINAYADERGTDKHPPKRDRLTATRSGWERADREIRELVAAEVPRAPAPSAPRTVPQPAPRAGTRPAPRASIISADNTSRLLAPGWWTWTVFIDASPEVLEQIKCVQYQLDETFRPSTVQVCERGAGRPFAMRAEGWGVFPIQIRVLTKDNQQYNLSHMLKLQ
jgi:YEATS family